MQKMVTYVKNVALLKLNALMMANNVHYSQRKYQVGSAIRQTTKKPICAALIQKPNKILDICG